MKKEYMKVKQSKKGLKKSTCLYEQEANLDMGIVSTAGTSKVTAVEIIDGKKYLVFSVG
tara:strand:- start:306 stop:482 length:177 start_codon:yes stop_codon:yes gene_type:complete